MSGATFGRDDRFDRFVIASVALHLGVFAFALLSPSLFPARSGEAWGSKTGGDGGIDVRIVSSVSGIELPSPPVVQEKAVANDSSGLYTSEPIAKPVVTEEAPVLIPSKAAPAKPKAVAPAPRAVTKTAAVVVPPPANAVPYGDGGRPAIAYGQSAAGTGPAGVSGFGDGAFGDRYGAYVQAMTRKISESWLRATVDNSVKTAPKVYMMFTIARDGTVSDIKVDQSSGIPSLDRSAESALRRASPLPALPLDYRGSNVSVRFYFEYAR